MLDANSSVPLYAQLLERWRKMLRSGELQPGDRFPSELDLARDYGVARITVRRAISELVRDGVLVRRPGKGSFVAAPKIERELVDVASFSARMQAVGVETTARVLDVRTMPATAELARLLTIAEGAPVMRLQRVRLTRGEPTVLETSHIPLDRCPGIVDEDFVANSLYQILADRYGLHPASSHKTLELTYASQSEGRLLEVAPGSPLFLLQAVVSAADRTVLEYAKTLYRGDRFRFRV
jgi:GntR family transcriptional regulator